MCKGSDQPGHTFSLIIAFTSCLNTLFLLKLLIEHHLEFLSLKGCHAARMSLQMSKRHIFENHMSIYSFSDIDECEVGTHLCDQVCTNTDGAYSCSCLQGYQLSLDRKTCDGKQTSTHSFLKYYC